MPLPPLPVPLRHAFRPREIAVLRALARTLIPPGGALAPAGDDVDLERAMDLYFETADRESLRAFRAMTLLFEFLPFPFTNKVRPFTRLDESARAAVVDDWARSRFYPRRAVLTGLKALVAMAYASHPPVERALGYDPRCLRGEPGDPPAGDGVTGLGTDPPEVAS